MIKKLINALNKWVYDMRFRDEFWKDIPNYEKRYRISNHGRIRSLHRKVKHGLVKSYTLEERILKPSTENGYARVFLYKDKKAERVYVHRLMAEIFMPLPDCYKDILPYIKHTDGNRLNNHINNLKYSGKRNSPK